jgi:hypothetical protein
MNTNAQPFEMTNKGLQVTLPLIEIPNASGRVIAFLHNCRYEDDFEGPLGIVLQSLETNTVYRRKISVVQVVALSISSKTKMRTIYIRSPIDTWASVKIPKPFPIRFKFASLHFLPFPLCTGTIIQPPTNGTWNPDTHVLRMWPELKEPSYVALCYKNHGIEQAFVKVVVSPIETSGGASSYVGLCNPAAPANEYGNLPEKLTVWVDEYTTRVAVKIEKKIIMDELVLEVTLDLKGSLTKV